MGTWATGLYADDEAQDARDSYREILSSGLDGASATDRFLNEWKAAMKDSDDGPGIWFALADTQWTLGRLEDRVRDAAIKIIDDGSSLDRWREAGAKLAEKRQAVLLALKKKLLSPQPATKLIKIRKAAGIATWAPGELFSYRLRSGRQIVLCLESIDKNQAGRLSALNWVGDAVPDEKTLKSLKRKRIAGSRWTMWDIIGSKKKDVPLDRMVRLGVCIATERDPIRKTGLAKFWRALDTTLEQFFGWT
jgi:hypothetical protein